MRPGDVVADRFLIERMAASGGMGVVYRAKDSRTGQPVALKLLRTDTHLDVGRFEREAEILAAFEHPGIVKYVAHGVAQSGERYLVMEWLDGECLSARLRRQRLSIEECVQLGFRVCATLGAAHRRGIVHRDIKPSNLFLLNQQIDAVKVIDFGIARAQGGFPHLTLTGAMVGTPGYMAPEQARGEANIDARADVFSLGCVLFQCLTGQRPFRADDMMAVLLKVVLEEAPRVRTLNPDVPEQLDQVVSKMLEKSPLQRLPDANAVSQALCQIERYLPQDEPDESVRNSIRMVTEQRVVCVVLGRRVARDEENIETLSQDGQSYVATRVIKPGVDSWRAAVERHGGVLSILADGSLLVTVGEAVSSAGSGRPSTTAMDQAAQAARSALALLPLVNAKLAVIAGKAIVAGTDGFVPMGEVIERGVALLAKEPSRVDVIGLDDVAAALIEGSFDVRQAQDRWFLHGELEATGANRTLLGRAIPCWGRDREIQHVLSVWEACLSEPSARVVLITGPPGIGKSRIRREVLRVLKQHDPNLEVWFGRGHPICTGSPFTLLAPAIRGAIGILGGDGQQACYHKLSSRVQKYVGNGDASRVTDFLAELAGVSAASDTSPQLDAARQDRVVMGNQMRLAWEDFIEAELAAHPVLLVFEDLHWGDLASINFVDSALRHAEKRPFLVLALARPEVHDLFPRLWRNRRIHEITLGPVDNASADALVVNVLGRSVSPAVRSRIVQRAEGNPFYLEELMRAAVEGKGEDLPESVLAIVQARLEALDDRSRRVLRAASVFGRVFWRSGVLALLAESGCQISLRQETDMLDTVLSELLDREIIGWHRDHRFSGEDEFIFHNPLLRDAAYATLTNTDAQLAHKAAAAWLLSRHESDAGLLAQHYELGGDRAQAIEYYLRAAERSLAGNDFTSVLSSKSRAIACGASQDTLGRFESLAASAHFSRGEIGDSYQCAKEAMRLLPYGSAGWFTVAARTAMASARLGMAHALMGTVHEILNAPNDELESWSLSLFTALYWLFNTGHLALAEHVMMRLKSIPPDVVAKCPRICGALQGALAIQAAFTGDSYVCLQASRVSRAIFSEVGDYSWVFGHYVGEGLSLTELGAYEEAERCWREAIARGRRIQAEPIIAVGHHNLSLVLAYLGRMDESSELAEDSFERFLASGNRRMIGACRQYQARIHAMKGDLKGALQHALAAVEILPDTAATVRARTFATLAMIQLELRQFKEALAAAQQTKELLDALGILDEGDSFVRRSHVETLFAVGDLAAARTAAQLARDRVLARASTISDPAYRQSFLERVTDNARILVLAQLT